jgi:peptidoglycan hydrolase CwlO-like protein
MRNTGHSFGYLLT